MGSDPDNVTPIMGKRSPKHGGPCDQTRLPPANALAIEDSGNSLPELVADSPVPCRTKYTLAIVPFQF